MRAVFVQQDKCGFRAGDTNLRRYVGNSPTNATDPSGLWVLPGGPWTLPDGTQTHDYSQYMMAMAQTAPHAGFGNWASWYVAPIRDEVIHQATVTILIAPVVLNHFLPGPGPVQIQPVPGKPGYVDVNVTLTTPVVYGTGPGVTFGGMVGINNTGGLGAHPYFGGAWATPGGSFTGSISDSISEGWNGAVSGFIGPGAQYGGGLQGQGDFFEVGIGTPGGGASVFYVFPSILPK